MYIVLPLALLFAGVFVCAFIWAVRHGQLDDLETPAARMLFDDDGPVRGTAGGEKPGRAGVDKSCGEPRASAGRRDEGSC